MLPFIFNTADPTEGAKPPLVLYNTLGRKKERFTPLKDDYVRMYNCGPTVYDYAHIGNLRSYVFADILRRVLLLNGYKVRQVVNITDIGHLTSDADDGDDKMTVGLKREGLPITFEGLKQLADMYTEAFQEDLVSLNIKAPSELPRASEHIPGDIALIEALIHKNVAYQTPDGVYFDTERFEGYGKLGGIDIEGLKEGARVQVNTHKRNPADFALWKRGDDMGWDSPWGKGFPGWHMECSVMAMEYLGKEIDIHTGGIDHIGTHHNNEIAQSEAANSRPFAHYWLHHAHILVEGTKFSKSLRNAITLRQLIEHGYSPIAYRYWLLSGHYRTPMNFSFSTLDGVMTTLKRLHRFFVESLADTQGGEKDEAYALAFLKTINEDLDTPGALALMWKLVKDDAVDDRTKRATLLHFDKVLGIGLVALARSGATSVFVDVLSEEAFPDEVKTLLAGRETARNEKDWARADELRAKLLSHGYAVEDTTEGPKVTRV